MEGITSFQRGVDHRRFCEGSAVMRQEGILDRSMNRRTGK
jgi:hypothetical protein